MERNTFSNDIFTLSPVTDFSSVTGDSFTSGDADIDDFFLNDARRHFKDGMAVTYQLVLTGSTVPLAFVSLQNDAIHLQEDERQAIGYQYKAFPAVKIGRLGVDKPLQGAGTGSVLLAMLKNFMRTGNRTGCRFITLDAYNKAKILHFYTKNGFHFLKDPKPGQHQVPMYCDLFPHGL